MKICPHCRKVMSERTAHERRINFCSQSCKAKALNHGGRITEAGKKRLSALRKGSNNPNWKGHDLTYKGLHARIKTQLPKPERCQDCGKVATLDLANISQKYLLDVSDWEWLCRLCHMMKDGRREQLIQRNKYAGK